MITFAGKSGAGKSMIAQQLKHSFIDHNPDQKFEVLSFEFEMLTSDQIARAFSAKLDKSTQELYSGAEKELTRSRGVFEVLSYETKKFSNLPIYYVDEGGSVEHVIDTI